MNYFKDIKKAVSDQFTILATGQLFKTNVSKDDLWDTYLGSFPAGTNPIYRERTEHDCQCCKQFIRACGNVVGIRDGKMVSIWDIDVGGHYQVVADAMSALVKSAAISDSFLHYEKNLGTDFNHQQVDGDILRWDHFHYSLPSAFVKAKDSIPTILSRVRSSKEVFQRALDEISDDAVLNVLELIDQGSLYRGEENKASITNFMEYKKLYKKIRSASKKDIFCWENVGAAGVVAGIRNTAIGTLLVDLSEDMDLDGAVRKFEAMVAPTNYKRPTALITKSMIAQAQKKVDELGISGSLQRRYAVTEDITINNVLFADREAKKAMNVFDELSASSTDKVKNLDKVEEVSIETFIESIVPKAESIEVLLENSHINNMVSLIAPMVPDAAPIFKWPNNFSWAYNGEVTDSIKERVKNAGGNVNGVLRASLSWFNYDDLDIHVVEPNRNHIHYGNKVSPTSGKLDVDMNVSSGGSRNAVENIVWTDASKMYVGEYFVYIHNFSPRESIDVGFDVELEFAGKIYTFRYDKKVVNKVPVCKFNYTHEGGVEIIESLPSTETPKTVWNLTTCKFHKVSMLMQSPNHWDDKAVGNKHWFFMLKDCVNDKPARGFFNEFLDTHLNEHRKVFEVLGSKMKTAVSDEQLSGVGFSSTQRNHVLCRVTGSFNRVVKVKF